MNDQSQVHFLFAPTPSFGADFASFASEKLCPLFEVMHFAITVDPKTL
jgi:hypothetical protein